MDPIWIRIRIHNIASELTWGEVYTVPVHVWLVTKSARYILYTYSIYCITVHILIYWHCNRRPVRHWFHSKYTCEFKGKLLFYSFKWRDPDSYTGWKSKKSKICRNLKNYSSKANGSLCSLGVRSCWLLFFQIWQYALRITRFLSICAEPSTFVLSVIRSQHSKSWRKKNVFKSSMTLLICKGKL